MSVFIEDYCKKFDNGLSAILQQCREEIILIGSDELEFSECRVPEYARIFIAHTLTCNDFNRLQMVLDGHYWYVCSSLGRSGFELHVSLDGMTL